MSNRLTKGQALVGSLTADVGITATSGLTASSGNITATVGNVVATIGDVKASASTGAGWFPYGVYTDTGGACRSKVIVIPISNITGTSDTDSGVDLPSNGIVRDAWLKITTAASNSQTLSVGLLSADAGTTNGFLSLVAVGTTGVKQGWATLSSTGTNAQLSVLSITRGPYLVDAVAGSTGAQYFIPKYYSIDTKSTALSVSYSVSAVSTAIVGNIFLKVDAV